MINFKQKILVVASITAATVVLILTGTFLYRHLHNKNSIPPAPPPPNINLPTEYRDDTGFLYEINLNDDN